LTTDADPVCPLLENIRATGSDIVVLDRDIVASEVSFCNVEAGPAARIEGVNVFNQLA
jgi:hypothetical protein